MGIPSNLIALIVRTPADMRTAGARYMILAGVVALAGCMQSGSARFGGSVPQSYVSTSGSTAAGQSVSGPAITGSAGSRTSVATAGGSIGGTAGSAGVNAYRLGTGDKIRVIVFGEDELSGEFFVDDGGAVDLPLIGDIAAAGATVGEFEERVVTQFKDGYLRDPKVAIEVLNYRPFFILGEVKKGGEYSFKAGLTVQDAVAMAGGYSYRANTKSILIRRAGLDREERHNLAQRVLIYPGDNLRVPERFF